MRNAALLLLFFVVFGYAARSQRFSLLPQVGFENSKTKISYNDLGSFSPMGVKFTPQASLRLNYSSKQGQGFFLGVASSRSIVSFNFTDPETARNNFTTTTGNMQLRLEGGYQFNTKPISLGRSTQSSAINTNNTERKNCCSGSSHCCSRNSNKARENSLAKNKDSWVRIQPSVGMGFIPAVKNDIITKTQGTQTTYQYNAGNWNTALIAGAGFEFGKGSTRLLTISVNYFKGFGNLDERTISSVSGGKAVTTTFESAASGWNLKAGIPFTLKGKNKTERKTEHRRSGCGQYRVMYRCIRTN
jgi:hypothetical protein